MGTRHDFETMQGDEMSEKDMINSTWWVKETFVDIDEENGDTVFTHRVEVTSIDFVTLEGLEG